MLITSDNHLGFKEMDPVRSEDSFVTFEEVLSVACQEGVDLVLQGGDLFHENKPSRHTYNRTFQILKKYCLGETRPLFRLNADLNFGSPSMGVSLPIFSIHGNHDDPGGFSNTSPLDVLHSSGLINYFGKVDNVDDIELHPILIQSDRKVAIFGLGHIKDRRVYRTFLKGNVKYKRPAGEGWYNILVVHQNRVPRKEEYLPEDFIDSFFDLVVYGHEHESIVIKHKNFDVIQCGSSIRTSLCDGEKSDKYVYVLELLGRPCIRTIPLKTVRPLIIESIRVVDGNPETQIRHKIEEMIRGAAHSTTRDDSMTPLVRLKVELGARFVLNKSRIYPFLEKNVANPLDSLKIIRKTERGSQKPTLMAQRGRVEDIYKDILQGMRFNTLLQFKVMDSLRDFVGKDNREAFTTMVKESIAEIISNIDFEGIVADDIGEAIRMTRGILARKNDESPVNVRTSKSHGHSIGNETVNTLQLECPHSHATESLIEKEHTGEDADALDQDMGVVSSQNKKQKTAD